MSVEPGLGRHPIGLPAELTRFIGRRRELAIARAALERSRLVTLTGTGGVGKTRLALELARELGRAFSGGVRVAALAEVNDPALLGHTVNAVLGVREVSAQWQLETVVEFVGDRQLLLVMDNCEHLVDEVGDMVAALLRWCPHLTVLATSRQALNIDGESPVPVPPLTVPDSRFLPSADDEEAVKLFVDRASTVAPHFALTPDNHAQVVALCRMLDGLPLAIELAAVRLRVLPLAELAERMRDRYQLLTHGSRTAPARHQTLRACIDWTYELCSPAERLLWARLSLFRGGFGLDAAEAVAAGGEIAREVVLDLIGALIDKSILSRVLAAPDSRFHMLETIREYGAERLSERERTDLERRHRDWFVALGERIETDWSGPRQAQWLERLRFDHPDIRAALGSGVVHDPRAGLRLAVGLENVWLARGFLSEGRQWLTQLLDGHPEPTIERGRGLRLAAWLAVLQGDVADVPGLLAEAAEIAGATGDEVLAAFIGLAEGLAAEFRGDLTEALALLRPAAAEFERLGHRTGHIHTLFEVALTFSFARDNRQSAVWHERCQKVAGAVGESFWRSYSLWSSGMVRWQAGDLAAAAALVEEGLRLKRDLDDRLGIGCCLEAMSWIAASAGDPERSARLLGAADAALRAAGMPLERIQPMWGYHLEGERNARRQATERGFRSAYAAGSAMTTETAVAYALRELTDPVSTADAVEAHPLTRREREVSELVADGLTNREIAARLVISVRTAEKHVDNIMSKLGAVNRAQVASRVARRRVLDPSPAPHG